MEATEEGAEVAAEEATPAEETPAVAEENTATEVAADSQV